MKMLMVAASDQYTADLAYHLKPLGFTLERISDPVRAMEEMENIDPQAVLCSASDFPRHWKALVKLGRQKKNKEDLIFILMAPPDFELDEAAKAAHLGVNGIIGEKLSDKQELFRLEELVRRYHSVKDKRSFQRLVPSEVDILGFAFTHPLRLSLVMGTLREISIQGASFYPTQPSAAQDLPVGLEIHDCSLKIGEDVIHVTCRLTRNHEELGFQFLSFEEGGHHKLLKYIQERPDRALKSALAAKG